jgi:hypothetical protein
MATTTPNYGWTVPTSTDLVKDGATAIETLGDAIDASMNTALGTKKAGMVLLNTTSFSGVASSSLPANTFTSTYRNYLIKIQYTGASASGTLTTRFRASGSDNTNANYQRQVLIVDNTSVTATRDSNQTSLILSAVDTNTKSVDIYVSNPQVVDNTYLFINFNANSNTSSPILLSFSGGFNATTQFDSMSFNSSGANISGYYRVYGFND